MNNLPCTLLECLKEFSRPRETVGSHYPERDMTAGFAAFRAVAVATARERQSGTAAERASVLAEVSAHSARVALYTWWLTRAIEAGGSRIGDPDASAGPLALAAMFHDIGKMAVSAHLLALPRRLRAEEFARVKAHTILGAGLIESMASDAANPLRRIVVEVCEGHHERCDGSGYPHGLSGSWIPYSARIVSVCDTYDAVVHKRVYASGRSHDTAMQIISDGRGTLFDPDIVDTMLAVGPVFRDLQITV